MTRKTFTIAAVAFVCQRSSQLAAGDAISFRAPHAYIKHRKANIKHFLGEGLIRVAWERNRVKTSCFAILAEI
jgi:hypothetical protein